MDRQVEKVYLHLFLRPNPYRYDDNDPLYKVRVAFSDDKYYDDEWLAQPPTAIDLWYDEPSYEEGVKNAVDALETTMGKAKTEAALRERELQDRINNLLALPAPEAAE